MTVDLFKNEEDSGVFQVTENQRRDRPLPATTRFCGLSRGARAGVPAAGAPWPLGRLRRAPVASPAPLNRRCPARPPPGAAPHAAPPGPPSSSAQRRSRCGPGRAGRRRRSHARGGAAAPAAPAPARGGRTARCGVMESRALAARALVRRAR